jgi:hypothetical protein
MRNLTGEAADATMTSWWEQLQPGDELVKVITPCDFGPGYVDDPKYLTWRVHGREEAAEWLICDPFYSQWMAGYGTQARQAISRGVRIERIVLFDDLARLAKPESWRQWYVEVYLPFFSAQTGEHIVVLDATIAGLSMRMKIRPYDVNRWGRLGTMRAHYDYWGDVSARDFLDRRRHPVAVARDLLYIRRIQQLAGRYGWEIVSPPSDSR